MPELTATHLFEAPAAQVWQTLADFGAIQRWWPADTSMPIEGVTLEGEGIGMVRHIVNKGAPAPISERLELLDTQARRLVLSIVGQRPRGITAYVAEGRVIDMESGRCQLQYRALYTTAPGCEESVRRALLKTWELMFRGLERACR